MSRLMTSHERAEIAERRLLIVVAFCCGLAFGALVTSAIAIAIVGPVIGQ